MKKGILILLMLVPVFVQSQSVSGIVVNEDEEPVEFASVRLFRSADSTVATGIYTNELGEFKLTGFPIGNYFIKITYSNYEDVLHGPLGLKKTDKLSLGKIQMSVDKTLELEGVVAEGSLDVLKAGIDKKVYNVKDDIGTKGGTVNDVLNNIPSIDIDQDGNISLRGDGNVTILIDGRPSGLVLGDGQNLLDALPANSIERVEVVTNPSAKYDPDGTSGIINIVMKKNKLKGFNGIVSATAATGNLFEGNFAFSYRNKVVNAYVNYSINYREGYRNYYSDLYRDITSDSTIHFSQRRDGTDLKYGNTVVLGSDFFINDRNVIGVSATGSLGERERTGNLQNEMYDGNGDLYDKWDRNSLDPRSNRNFDVNLNYSMKLKEEKGELSMVASHSFGDKVIEGFYDEQYYSGTLPSLVKSPLEQRLSNDESNGVTTAQVDFNYIFKEIRARMETGAKMILNSETIDTYSETKDTLSGDFMEDTLSNFNYSFLGDIYSVYGIFGQELGKFKYQVGVRGEYAEQFPQLLSEGTNFFKSYLNVYPSAHLKYELSKKSEFGLSYSRRINRPRSRQLNPFTSYADPFNLRSGNPELEPEYIDSYDLSYSLTLKKVILTTSVFHRRTQGVINRVKYYRLDNTAIVTYGNIDNSVSTGFEAVLIYKPFKWFKNTISFNGNHIAYSNDDTGTDWNNDGFNWGVKYIGTIDFWKNTASFQVNAAYRAPRVTPQGIVLRRPGVNLSVEKRLLNKQLSIGARVTDVFDWVGFELELEQEGITQIGQYKWLTRRFYLTASYKFGKFDKKRMPKVRSGGDGMD
jgi:outer membrane receptor protein involved in Fe transport